MFFIELLKVIFLGIVEGITEWLPISSTGHMILVDEPPAPGFGSLQRDVPGGDSVGGHPGGSPPVFPPIESFLLQENPGREERDNANWYKVIVGVIPAGVAGLLFDDWLNEHLYNYWTVAIMLILYGILFILIETGIKARWPGLIVSETILPGLPLTSASFRYYP